MIHEPFSNDDFRAVDHFPETIVNALDDIIEAAIVAVIGSSRDPNHIRTATTLTILRLLLETGFRPDAHAIAHSTLGTLANTWQGSGNPHVQLCGARLRDVIAEFGLH